MENNTNNEFIPETENIQEAETVSELTAESVLDAQASQPETSVEEQTSAENVTVSPAGNSYVTTGFVPYSSANDFVDTNSHSTPSAASAPAPKAKKQKSGKGGIIAVAICCSLIGGLVGGACGARYFGRSGNKISGTNGISNVYEGSREKTVLTVNHIDTSKLMTLPEVYAANVDSTVGIRTTITTNYWGYQSNSAASGSGFILTDDGYILTNYHVIEDSSSITVSFYDGTSSLAKLIGYDEANDIAVIKVDAEGLVPVVLGDSDNLNVGETVAAIGNPLGELTFSMTQGAVSALDREVTLSSTITMKLIQTDCAINSGNSGGPLFNLYGEVVGITNAKYSSSGYGEASIDNIGFAIPINSVKNIVKSIIEKGYIAKPYIGVSVADVSEETQSYGLPAGASVKEVVEGSPSEEAGLQINDIITHINGEAISSSSDLVQKIGETNPDDVLTLTVYRRGETIEVEITVGEKIQSAVEAKEDSQQSSQSQQSNPWSLPDWFFNFGF